LTINNVSLAEGRTGISYFVFTVSLSAISDLAANQETVNFVGDVEESEYTRQESNLQPMAP
jgi:hypothetical protein